MKASFTSPNQGWSEKRHDVANTLRHVVLWGLIILVTTSCKREITTGSSSNLPPPAQIPGIVTLSIKELATSISSYDSDFTVVNIWATWCPPCLHEMPEFAKFYQKIGNKNIRFFSIVVLSDPEKTVKPFLEKNQIPFKVYWTDLTSPDELLYELNWETEWDGSLPATFLLDKSGKIIKSWFQEITAEELLSIIDSHSQNLSVEK